MTAMHKWKNWLSWTTVGLLILGWIVNRLLDLTVSGTLKVWSHVLQVATLGSQKMRDLPYESAALNPYPVASLVLLFLVVAAIGLSASFLAGYTTGTYRAWRIRNKTQSQLARNSIDAPSYSAAREHVRWRLQFGAFTVVAILAADGCIFVPFSILNTAVAARRVYEANRDMVAPYVSPMDLLRIQGEFAAMETKDNYLSVMHRIQKIGDAQHIKLHAFE